jgi:hypothetical protein
MRGDQTVVVERRQDESMMVVEGMHVILDGLYAGDHSSGGLFRHAPKRPGQLGGHVITMCACKMILDLSIYLQSFLVCSFCKPLLKSSSRIQPFFALPFHDTRWLLVMVSIPSDIVIAPRKANT